MHNFSPGAKRKFPSESLLRCKNTVNAYARVPFTARAEIPFRLHGTFSDFQARLAGLKILARFEDTGLGFSTRAELRPGLNPSPCNRQLSFQRVCFRRRSEIRHVIRPLETNEEELKNLDVFVRIIEASATATDKKQGGDIFQPKIGKQIKR